MIGKARWFILPQALLWVCLLAASVWAEEAKPAGRVSMAVPDDFPRFTVPGCEREMSLLRELFWLHYQPAGPLIPLWDEWMPMSTLWPARAEGAPLQAMRRRWAATLAGQAQASLPMGGSAAISLTVRGSFRASSATRALKSAPCLFRRRLFCSPIAGLPAPVLLT
jgi:hypothetical protein